MSSVIKMPKIGVNMTDAVMSQWLVKEGDMVDAGQVIMLAETDKAVQEIPITESGRIARLIVQEFDRVECQQPILVLADPDEQLGEDEIDAIIAASVKMDTTEPDVKNPISESNSIRSEKLTPEDSERSLKISPFAKKKAQELGIDYHLVPPAKPGTRITSEDVIRYADSLSSEPVQDSRKPALETRGLTSMRKTIAERMTASVLSKPSVPLTLHADASSLMDWREHSKKVGNEIRYNEMLIAIAAKALREFPIMNAAMPENAIEYHNEINIGFAVDCDDGLVVPKIFDADKKSVLEIGNEIREKTAKIRNGRIDLKDIEGGTFTITNLGMYEIEQFDAIINPPECCILAVGTIVKQPVVRDNAVVVGHQMQLTLVFDHRIVDGLMAARFLQRIKHLVEAPVILIC